VLESSKSARVVGVDVGGTTVKAALVSGKHRPVDVRRAYEVLRAMLNDT